jgi:hypothetical protein
MALALLSAAACMAKPGCPQFLPSHRSKRTALRSQGTLCVALNFQVGPCWKFAGFKLNYPNAALFSDPFPSLNQAFYRNKVRKMGHVFAGQVRLHTVDSNGLPEERTADEKMRKYGVRLDPCMPRSIGE